MFVSTLDPNRQVGDARRTVADRSPLLDQRILTWIINKISRMILKAAFVTKHPDWLGADTLGDAPISANLRQN